MENKTKSNMYSRSIHQWSPFTGCRYGCVYCRTSFQAQLKRYGKKNCCKCYAFEPHEHLDRLNQGLPRTGYGQFIFTCPSGDVAFSTTECLQKIIDKIKCEPEKTFLIQSKNPITFNRLEFPNNVILGATLETNRDDLYESISKAPKPTRRYKDFLAVNHALKMVTVEPAIDFDLNVMIDWLGNVNPCLVWIGYDSRRNRLPEPPLEQVRNLYWELGKRGFTVVLKRIRRAWWEK